MKKYTLICIGLCAAMAFTSCKSSESAYKKAYEKAKQYDTNNQQAVSQTATDEAVVAPVEAKPVDQARVVDNLDNIYVRQESVALVSGSGLKAYSVVVASMTVKANAESLQYRLKSAGYDAQIVQADVHGQAWYRVIAETFDDKLSAVKSRDQIRGSQFNKDSDAWLLYNAR